MGERDARAGAGVEIPYGQFLVKTAGFREDQDEA
jgi:hypothetical protein